MSGNENHSLRLIERGFWGEISKNKLPKISLITGRVKLLGREMMKYLKISPVGGRYK